MRSQPSQDSSQKIFSIPRSGEQHISSSQDLINSFEHCVMDDGIDSFRRLHSSIASLDWIDLRNDRNLREAFNSFALRKKHTGSANASRPKNISSGSHLEFAFTLETVLFVLSKGNFLFEESVLLQIFKQAESVFTHLAKKPVKEKLRVLDRDSHVLSFGIPRSAEGYFEIPSTLLSRIELCRTIKHFTVKNYLTLLVLELLKSMLQPHEDPVSADTKCHDRARPRSFLDSEQSSLEESHRAGEHCITGHAKLCMESHFLLELLEEIVDEHSDYPQCPTFLPAIAFLESLTSKIHLLSGIAKTGIRYQDMFHIIRLGLAKHGNMIDSEARLSLLRASLHLANESGSEEFMSNRLFFNQLQGTLQSVMHRSINECADEIALISCIFCTFLRRVNQKASLQGARVCTGLKWLLQTYSLHDDLAKIIHADLSTENTDNQLLVASSYCALFFACMSALLPIALIANGATRETPSHLLARLGLDKSILVRKLQEFIIFQSEAKVLTKDTLMRITSVIEEINLQNSG